MFNYDLSKLKFWAKPKRNTKYQYMIDTINDVLDHAKTHNQGVWIELDSPLADSTKIGQPINISCNSSACLAGHAVMNDPDVSVVVGDSYEIRHENGRPAESYANVDYVIDHETEDYIRIPDHARELFGLTDVQAAILFSGDNSREALLHMASRIILADADGKVWPDSDGYDVQKTYDDDLVIDFAEWLDEFDFPSGSPWGTDDSSLIGRLRTDGTITEPVGAPKYQSLESI